MWQVVLVLVIGGRQVTSYNDHHHHERNQHLTGYTRDGSRYGGKYEDMTTIGWQPIILFGDRANRDGFKVNFTGPIKSKMQLNATTNDYKTMMIVADVKKDLKIGGDLDLNKFLAMVFNMSGLKCINLRFNDISVANDGLEALEKLKDHPYCLWLHMSELRSLSQVITFIDACRAHKTTNTATVSLGWRSGTEFNWEMILSILIKTLSKIPTDKEWTLVNEIPASQLRRNSDKLAFLLHASQQYILSIISDSGSTNLTKFEKEGLVMFRNAHYFKDRVYYFLPQRKRTQFNRATRNPLGDFSFRTQQNQYPPNFFQWFAKDSYVFPKNALLQRGGKISMKRHLESNHTVFVMTFHMVNVNSRAKLRICFDRGNCVSIYSSGKMEGPQREQCSIPNPDEAVPCYWVKIESSVDCILNVTLQTWECQNVERQHNFTTSSCSFEFQGSTIVGTTVFMEMETGNDNSYIPITQLMLYQYMNTGISLSNHFVMLIVFVVSVFII